MPQFLDITCSGVLLQDNLLFTTKLRLIFETAAFFYKYYKRKTLISEAEGRPGGPGGLGPQYIEDIRRKKSDAMRRSFCASGGS